MIDKFRNEHRYLSNMYEKAPFIIVKDGKIYKWKSSEHFYQANKFKGEHFENIYRMNSPYDTKKYARKYKKDIMYWDDDSKKDVMIEAVINKFTQNQELLIRLIKTLPHELVEGNTWCDNFWGNCSCGYCTKIESRNILGIILMKVRQILISF